MLFTIFRGCIKIPISDYGTFFDLYTYENKTFMKFLFSTLFLSASLLLTSFKLQSGIEEVIGALKNGNASEMSRFIDENVDITLPQKRDTYSKAQAAIILKDFFSNNSVLNFDLKHKGDNDGDQYCVGTLQTKAGNYRTMIFMKVKANRQVIKDIRFQSVE